jgi:hypothetical protein
MRDSGAWRAVKREFPLSGVRPPATPGSRVIRTISEFASVRLYDAVPHADLGGFRDFCNATTGNIDTVHTAGLEASVSLLAAVVQQQLEMAVPTALN